MSFSSLLIVGIVNIHAGSASGEGCGVENVDAL